MSEYKHKITVLTPSYSMSDYIEENIVSVLNNTREINERIY